MKKIKGYIKRSTMLYKTGVEYGDYTMNHVQGCSHGCLYPCYAYLMKKRFGVIHSYDEWKEPCLVSNTLELLDKEIPRMKDKIKSVHLCFSTDPFMYQYPEIEKMSIDAIKKLNSSGIKCVVLTKGILPSELATLYKKNEYGITMVTTKDELRKRFEPYSAPLGKRLKALESLHNKGYKTWVSIEPFPTPNIFEQDLDELLNRVRFVDKVVFGRMHYNKEVTAYKVAKEFFNESANKVIEFCKTHNISYHIKKGTITEL